MTTPAYNVNTPFNNYFFYKNGPNQGSVLVGGTIDFYSADDHNARLDTYSDISDPDNPVVNPNPIVLGADGSTGNSTANSPVVYMQQEPYFIVVTSAEGTVQFTVDNYNGAILDPNAIIETDPRNFIIDGQFNLGIPVANPVDGTVLDYGGWSFQRNNDTATDSISFPPFTLGETDVPSNPYAWLHYNCSVAGSGETTKYVLFPFKKVRSFEGQTVTLSLYAKSAINSNLNLFYTQNFGTGGSPSAPINLEIAIPTLTTSATFYEYTFEVPSTAGKILGSNGDDFFGLVFGADVNVVADFYITNAQFQIGNTATDYEYKSYEQNYAESIQDILASETDGEDGASTIGYYDSIISVPAGTTVKAKLDSLQSQIYGSKDASGALVNSNLWVWTYGDTAAIATDETVNVADRWSVAVQTAGSAVATREEMRNTSLQLSENNFSDFYLRVVYTFGTNGDILVSHKTAGVASFNNEEVTVSWGLKNNTGTSVTYECFVFQNFGTGGSPSPAGAVILGTALTLTTGQEGVFSFTGTVPSISGKTIGDNNNDYMEFYLTTGDASDTSYTFIKLDIGQNSFAYIGRTYTEELNACRAYRFSAYQNGVEPGTSISGQTSPRLVTLGTPRWWSIDLPIAMVSVPTVEIYSTDGTAGDLTIYNNTGVGSNITPSLVTGPTTVSVGTYLVGGSDVNVSGVFVADTGK